MAYFVFLALLNGLFIGTSRAINGRLSMTKGALQASLWNHAVGFVFLSLMMAITRPDGALFDVAPPPYMWLSGLLGVAFVALNSHVVVRLGAGRTTSIVVAAQMLTSLAIDQVGAPFSGTTVAGLVGAALIVTGIALSRSAPAAARVATDPQPRPFSRFRRLTRGGDGAGSLPDSPRTP